MPKVHEGANRATAAEASSFVEECDRLEQERERKLDEMTVAFKAAKLALNQNVNALQAVQLDDAKKVGIKKTIIHKIVKGQKGIRKGEEMLARGKDRAQSGVELLEPEDRDYAVDIVAALGDDFSGFGLGAAAVKASKRPRTKTAAQAAAEAWGQGDEVA